VKKGCTSTALPMMRFDKATNRDLIERVQLTESLLADREQDLEVSRSQNELLSLKCEALEVEVEGRKAQLQLEIGAKLGAEEGIDEVKRVLLGLTLTLTLTVIVGEEGTLARQEKHVFNLFLVTIIP